MNELECGPMPNVMVALPNTGGRPLFKVWPTPTTRCRAVTLPKCETCWNLQGCLKLPDGSQPLVGRSSPYCGNIWRTYHCLTSLFPIVDTCLSCEDIAPQSCAMVPRWRLFCVLHFQRAACSRFQTCIVNSHWGHTMCGSMVDIQSTAAEIRRGKKRKIEITGQKYNGLPYYIGRP